MWVGGCHLSSVSGSRNRVILDRRSAALVVTAMCVHRARGWNTEMVLVEPTLRSGILRLLGSRLLSDQAYECLGMVRNPGFAAFRGYRLRVRNTERWGAVP
jgi:hypothetical protein